MRIEQNLLRRNPVVHATNGHHNGNGLHNSNNNSLTPTNLSNNKRNQEKEVGQDILVRKSTLQETDNEEKSSFLNPELQRELNRILAEAEEGDGKLSEDSSVSGCSTSSASSSEEEDDYEHPRRLFLEEIAEEDEEDLEEDEEEEIEEEEELEDDDDDVSESDEESPEQDVEDNKPADVLINPEENPTTAVDDTSELEASSDFASDSDATITNELSPPLPHEEIETGEIKAKFLQASRQFRREHETRRNNGKKQVEILLKVENVDGQSAVENEWDKEQIDEAPNETSAEHARGETGISTKQSKQAAYGEPVVVAEELDDDDDEAEQQNQPQHSQPYSSHLHEKYLKEATLLREEHKQYNPYPEHNSGGVSRNGESVTQVSQQEPQLLKFLQQIEEQSGPESSEERNSDSAYPTPYSCNAVAGQVDGCYEEKGDENDKDVDYDYDDDEEDDDDDDDGDGDSDSSSIGGFQELEQRKHEHVEIRLFHDDDGSSSSSSDGSNICSSAGEEVEVEQEQDQDSSPSSSRNGRNVISREWNGPVLVDLEQASTEVHELVPESPGESGTGSSSSSSLSSSSSPTPPSLARTQSAQQPPPSYSSLHPLKSSSLSSQQPKSSNLLGGEEKATNENVSQPQADSYSNNHSNKNSVTIAPPRPPPLPPAPPSLPISNHSSKSKLCNSSPSVRVVSSSLKKSTAPVTSSTINSSLFPLSSILVTSPRTSPSSSSEASTSSTSSSSTSSSKKKRVSFHEQIESKTYNCGDEPSSVSSSVSDFNPSQKDDSVIIVSSLRKKRASSNSSDHSSDLTVIPANSNNFLDNNDNNNGTAAIVEQELNSSFSASSSSSPSSFYNNCQFSTADFWAIRNGAGDKAQQDQQQQYLQSLYYSESDNSKLNPPTEEPFQQRRGEQNQNQPPQQYRQPSNHHYYYPTEYFTLSDSFPQNNTLGLPSPPSTAPVVVVESELPSSTSSSLSSSSSTSSISGRKFWGKAHSQQESIPEKSHNREEQHHSGGRTPTGAVVVGVTTKASGVPSPSAAVLSPAKASTTTTSSSRPTSVLDNNRNAEMHQRLSGGEHRLRSVLRKPGVGGVKNGKRSVTFNESLNLFYDAECSCWIHEDDYVRLRAEEQAQAQQQQQQHQHHQHQHHQHHQQFIYEQTHPHFPHTHHHHQNFIYEPPPIEFEDPPTLSPPEGYKDRFFPQEDPTDPDVTRVCPPSPPSARRKVFLKENSTDQLPPPPPQQKGVILNGLEDEEEDDESKKGGSGNSNSGSNTSGSKGSRLGGILKGGRLWRSNSAEGKKVTSPPDEPDVVKCTERDSRERLSEKDPSERPNTVSSGPSSPSNQVQTQESYQNQMPTKVSTGTAPLRTSEQIRLAVDSTLRLRTKKKPECSSLVEKLRWLTSLDDDDPSDSSSQSGFATWPSRDKNGIVTSTSSSKKSDAGTSTNEEFVNSAGIRQPPPIYSSSEAKIKQISYTLEDIDEGLKGSEIELESFITEDGGRIERLKKRYSGEEPGDDYGFSRRPSVKGIKPKFSSTNQIFAQYTAMRASGTETPIPVESQYENTRGLPPPANFDQIPNHLEGARMQLNYDIQNATGRPPEESRAHFEMIRQSFEHAASFSNFNRPHSWSVSTLPHPHHAHAHSNSISVGPAASPVPPTGGGMPANLLTNNFGSTLSVSQPMQQQQNNLSMNPSPINMNNPSAGNPQRIPDGVQMMAGNPAQIYGTLPSQAQMAAQQNQMAQAGQPIYGTVRRVPNVIGRPLFLHYGALSVEAHPNKIVQPFPRPTKVPETPSPTQQPPPLRYYGPPIRYYNSPPPVPPRSVTTSVSGGPGNPGGAGNGGPNAAITDCQQERGVPEGATDEEPSLKESYSMNV